MSDQTVKIPRSNLVTFGDARIEGLENFAPKLTRIIATDEDYDIAVRVGVYAEPVFKKCEMGVVFAEQARHEFVPLKWNRQPPFCSFRAPRLKGPRLGPGRPGRVSTRLTAPSLKARRPACACQSIPRIRSLCTAA